MSKLNIFFSKVFFFITTTTYFLKKRILLPVFYIILFSNIFQCNDKIIDMGLFNHGLQNLMALLSLF